MSPPILAVPAAVPSPSSLYLNDFTGLGSACLAVGILRALEKCHPQVRYAYPDNPLFRSPELYQASGLRQATPFPSGWRRFDRQDWSALADFFASRAVDTVVNFRNPDVSVDSRYPAFRAWYTERHRGLSWQDLYGRTADELAHVHIHQRMLQMLHAAGCACELSDLSWLATMRATPPGPPVVGLFCSASTPVKRWPVSAWVELVERLTALADPQFEILGGNQPEEQDSDYLLAEKLGRMVARGRIRFWPSGSLADLATRLGRLSLLIANDTGVGHLASACGTPTLSLFLSTDARVWEPRSAVATSMSSGVGMGCPAQRPTQGNCARHYDRCDAPCHGDLRPAEVAVAAAARLPVQPAFVTAASSREGSRC